MGNRHWRGVRLILHTVLLGKLLMSDLLGRVRLILHNVLLGKLLMSDLLGRVRLILHNVLSREQDRPNLSLPLLRVLLEQGACICAGTYTFWKALAWCWEKT